MQNRHKIEQYFNEIDINEGNIGCDREDLDSDEGNIASGRSSSSEEAIVLTSQYRDNYSTVNNIRSYKAGNKMIRSSIRKM